jgi:hypothetical protein
MSYSPPEPPTTIPSDLLNRLNGTSPDVLRDIARYTERLADHKERKARLDAANDDSVEQEAEAEETPNDVPPNATITIKEIKGNRYYYWQWRDGDKIRSKYKGPVNPSE